jgi:hypothetical protein
MKMSLEPVPTNWFNNVNYSSRNSWFLRGLEDFSKISITEFNEYGNSNILIPITSLFLPEPLKSIAFVPASSHIYFTMPEYPKTIRALYIPKPIPRSKIARKEFKEITALPSRQEDYLISYPYIDIDSDIIALAPTNMYLFILTVNRGRTRASDLWQVRRILVDIDKGFHDIKQDVVVQLDFPPESLKHEYNLSFSVANYTETIVSFYISGFDNGYIYWGRFRPSETARLSALLPEYWEPFPKNISPMIISNFIDRNKINAYCLCSQN